MQHVDVQMTEQTYKMCSIFAKVQHDFYDEKTSVCDYIIGAIEEKLFRDLSQISPMIDEFRAFFQDYPNEENLYSEEEWSEIQRDRTGELQPIHK